MCLDQLYSCSLDSLWQVSIVMAIAESRAVISVITASLVGIMFNHPYKSPESDSHTQESSVRNFSTTRRVKGMTCVLLDWLRDANGVYALEDGKRPSMHSKPARSANMVYQSRLSHVPNGKTIVLSNANHTLPESSSNLPTRLPWERSPCKIWRLSKRNSSSRCSERKCTSGNASWPFHVASYLCIGVTLIV